MSVFWRPSFPGHFIRGRKVENRQSLQLRTFVLISALFTGLFITILIISKVQVMGGFAGIERDSMVDTLDATMTAIDTRSGQLGSLATVWAGQEETRALILHPEKSPGLSRYPETIFTGTSTNVLAVMDRDGHVIAHKYVSLDSSQQLPTPRSLLASLERQSWYRVPEGTRGVLDLDSGPMLVVSVPVEDAHGHEAIGYLLVGRYLDVRELSALSESLGYQVSVGPGSLAGPGSPGDAVVFTDPDTIVVLESETEITGYRSVPGIGGTPPLLLKVTTPRPVHHYGLATMNYILLSLLLIGFVFGGAVLLLLEISVLSRVTRLSREVQQIGSSRNPGGRVTPEGNDEIASLAGAVNQMLSSLEHSRQSLEKSENRYAHLLNNANDCIFSTTPDGTLLSFNRQMKALAVSLGHEISVGKPLSRITSPDTAGDFQQALAEGLAHDRGEGGARVFNLVVIAADGNERILETNARFDERIQNSVPGYFCISRDITERILYESNLVAVTKKLKLLGDVTRHDIKNQLTVLLGYLEYLKMAESTDEREKVYSSLNKVTTRIHDQLEFTGDYQQLGVNGPTWQDLLITFKYAISHVDMAGIRQVIGTGPVEVFVDPLFEKALFNLVHNSLLHGDGVTEIRLTSIEQGGALLVAYEDNGCGIPNENKEKIFGEGFGKVNGFGLFLTREILAITKISIRETGEPGKGARFEISIPRGRFRYKQGLS